MAETGEGSNTSASVAKCKLLNGWRWGGLLALYVAFGVLVLMQAFTYPFADQNTELYDNYFISRGLVPYIDFFEHHPLFQNILLSPIFLLTDGSTSVLIGYELLAIAGVFFCAWLVFKIAVKNGLKNPHAASLLFLAGYTSLTVAFLRYEFWSMLFLLAFFAVSHRFWKGVFIVFLGATSPIVIFSAGAMGAVYAMSMLRKNKREFLWLCLGGIVAFVAWRLLHHNISFASMYYAIFTFNNLVGNLPGYALSWQEVTFFTLFIVIPIILMSIPILWKEWIKKNETAVLTTVFSLVFVLQIIAMNIVYGVFTRIKLPAPLPLIALLIVFAAGYGKKVVSLMVIGEFLLILLAFTPSFSFPQLEVVHAGQALDSCVAENASMLLLPDPHTNNIQVPLFRKPAEYYWTMQSFVIAAGIPYERPTGIDPISVCINRIEREDWICSAQELDEIRKMCEQIQPSKTIWMRVREWRASL